MSKHTRSQQSRINGAKSRGPVTPEGKARSAVNHTSHGMYSSRVVLDNENPELYALLLTLYTNLLQPEDTLESDLIENMVTARWRIRRLESSQTANMNLTLAEHRREFTKSFGPNLDPAMEQALTFRALTKEAKAFDTLVRFEERLHRIFERSYRLLLQHRKKSAKQLPSPAELRQLETDFPENNAPTPETERFEPEPSPSAAATPRPGLLAALAAFAISLFRIPATRLCALFHQWRAQFTIPIFIQRSL